MWHLSESNPCKLYAQTSRYPAFHKDCLCCRGEYCFCTNPPYGYIKDPEDKTRWIVDEEAAKVVREAFRLCMQGYGPSQIAKEFTRRRIMNPTAHARKNGINIPDNRGHDDDYIWRGSTIVH
ncbi:MAG TPA: recombinase family protein, partial [Lachnospiraceae bacterium]|nr:recombinase family protein [Lachnospiraceae bacterium]